MRELVLSLRDPCFSLRGSQKACKAYASLTRRRCERFSLVRDDPHHK